MKMADYVRSMSHSCLFFHTWSFYFLVCSKVLLDETKAVGRIWDVNVGELTMKSLGASGREYVYVYEFTQIAVRWGYMNSKNSCA